MYTIVLGFIVTFTTALIISAIFREANCDNPDLFTPIVAKRLQKQKSILKYDAVKMVIFIFC